MSRHEISDEQWEIIAPYIEIKRNDPRGRPSKDSRQMLNGSLWILKTGAKGGHFQQEIGRRKGGLTTKIHAVVNALGNPLRIKPTAGNIHDIPPAPVMITGCYSDHFLADGAYDADRLIGLAESQEPRIVIPPKSNRINQREYDRHIYKERHLVEGFFAKLKVFRRVSTRYEKLAKIYKAAVLIALCLVWLH